MNRLLTACTGLVFSIAAVIAVAASGHAATLPAAPSIHLLLEMAHVGGDDDSIIKIAHRDRPRAKRRGVRRKASPSRRKARRAKAGKRRPRLNKAERQRVRKHHRRFHKRYHPRRKNYRKAHRRFHRHYRRRHSGPTIYFGYYPDYYDPFYYDPRYYDPYYDGPQYRARLTCREARRIVRRHGYRRIKAVDCKGRVYGFIGTYKGRRYKVKVNAYSGRIVVRRRL